MQCLKQLDFDILNFYENLYIRKLHSNPYTKTVFLTGSISIGSTVNMPLLGGYTNNRRQCAHCRKIGENLPKCGRCNAVYYCNRECQLANRRMHKLICDHELPEKSPPEPLQTFILETARDNKLAYVIPSEGEAKVVQSFDSSEYPHHISFALPYLYDSKQGFDVGLVVYFVPSESSAYADLPPNKPANDIREVYCMIATLGRSVHGPLIMQMVFLHGDNSGQVEMDEGCYLDLLREMLLHPYRQI